MTIRVAAQVAVDDVLHKHGLGRATPLSAALVDAFLDTARTALLELAPDLLDDIAHGTDLALKVEDLHLPVHAYNCLKREYLHTARDLIARRALPGHEASLHDVRNLGARHVAAVLTVLHDHGIDHPDLAQARTQDWWPTDSTPGGLSSEDVYRDSRRSTS